ncbi:MAG: nitroreductase/quinone reductase family protein [Myxococcota bacterium]
MTVRLPAVLSQLIGGERSVAVTGETLREALDDLVRQRPALGLHLFDESGTMRRHILCFCNQVYTRGAEDLEVPVDPGDEITILNSVSGGLATAPERKEHEMSSVDLPDWIAEHMRQYLESDGEEGHIWRGVPTLLLTTVGRKSGEPRMLPLIYGRDGDRYIVVASKGGSSTHPAWYLNLAVDPKVRVQVGADKFAGLARTTTGSEREALWGKMSELFPPYLGCQARTTREIPVVALEPDSRAD